MRFVKFDIAEKDKGTRYEIELTVSSDDVDAALDEFYNIYMKNTMSREEYYKINYDICKKLKEDDRCI